MDTVTDSKDKGVATGAEMVSSGQIVAKMLKQEGIKHIYVRVNHSHI